MAERPGWSRSFNSDSYLQQYFLDEVEPTGKTLGVGSYGSVVEVKYRQVPCAAKCMHEILLDPRNAGVGDIIEKYRLECQLMAGLRHPNITQFLGLCFLKEAQLPLLVMEKLEMSVDDLLQYARTIPFPLKVSILRDTCSGLVYLHAMKTPIVHRDLTARNVLLTSSLTAKITDLGNSRMVAFRPGQLVQTLTKNPGTTVYMPPEALGDSHRYGTSLDVFSFGHLALYILIQVFPENLLSATFVDPHNPGRIIGRSEVERREVYMGTLESQFSSSCPTLVEMVTTCLHNAPQTRPSAEQLLRILESVQDTMEETYAGDLEKTLFIANVLHMKETREKNRRIRELEVSENRLIAINQELRANIAELERNVENTNLQLIDKMKHHQEETGVDQLHVDKLKSENNELKSENNELRKENVRLHTDFKNQLTAQKNCLEIHYEEEKLQSLELEVERLTKELQRSAPVLQDRKQCKNVSLTLPLQLDWKRGPDMPVTMSVCIQSVAIDDVLYVGGGLTDKSDYNYIVMAYNTQSCKWDTLTPYKTRWFAMIAMNKKLILVGGRARDYSYSSELGEWQPEGNQWVHPYPAMPTPRREPSVTSYKNWLVVAGGWNECCLQAVEVLDVMNMQWSTGPSTPVPWMAMKSATIGDSWYLMRGCCGDLGYVPDVFSVSLEALVSRSVSETSKVWRKLPPLNSSLSCPLNISRSLVAVGGRDMKSKKPVFTIQRYVPETNTWIQIGQLPHALYTCSCIMTSDKLYVMGGWDGKTRQKQLLTSSL